MIMLNELASKLPNASCATTPVPTPGMNNMTDNATEADQHEPDSNAHHRVKVSNQ